MNRPIALAGFAAPLVYVATVIVGGIVTPGYSHLDQPVSALFAVGAPYALPISAGFILYNLLLALFGLGLLRTLRWPALMILLNGAFGLVIELFPMDATGTPMTVPGLIHIVLAAGLVVTCIAAMALAAVAWWRAGTHRVLLPITVLLLVVMVVAGGIAAQAASTGWPPLGLFQRFTIGAYLVWIVLLSLDTRA